MTPQGRPPRVTYFDDNRVVEVEVPEQTILRISQLHRIPHMSECGGHARCTTCRVRCLDGVANLSPRTDAESVIAAARGWDPFTRLACQTRVRGDVVVERIIRSAADATRMRVEESGLERGREVSLVTLFCDLRGFTPLAERHLPYDVVHLLNRYFEAVGEPTSTTTAISTCTWVTRWWRTTAWTAALPRARVWMRSAPRCSWSGAWRT